MSQGGILKSRRRLLLGVFIAHLALQGALAANLTEYGQPPRLAETGVTAAPSAPPTGAAASANTSAAVTTTTTTVSAPATTTSLVEASYSAQGLPMNGGPQIALLGPLPNPITSANPSVAEVAAVFQPPLDPATGLPAPELLVFQPEVEALAKQINQEQGIGFGEAFWGDLRKLWYHESLFDTRAVHPSSGACSLVQALPCSKLSDISVESQVRQMLDYIRRRYTDPSGAWQAWKSRGHPCKQQPHPKGFEWCGGWY